MNFFCLHFEADCASLQAERTSDMTTTLRIDDDLKRDCDSVLQEIGLSFSGAVTLFLRQVVRTGSIPFALRAERPNRETREALREAERLAADPSAKTFDSVDDLFRDLDA